MILEPPFPEPEPALDLDELRRQVETLGRRTVVVVGIGQGERLQHGLAEATPWPEAFHVVENRHVEPGRCYLFPAGDVGLDAPVTFEEPE